MDNYEWLIAIIAIFVIIIFSAIYRKNDRIKYIKSSWGKIPSSDFINEDLEKYLKDSFNYLVEDEKNIVDDITWNDLDLMKIYNKINATQSSVGAEILYYKLRNLSMKDKDNFEETKLYFENNSEKRIKTQYRLSKLGKFDKNEVIRYISEDIDVKDNKLLLHILLGFLPIIGILTMILGKAEIGFQILFISIIFNFSYTLIMRKSLDGDFNTVNYLVQTVSTANKISKINNNKFDTLDNTIKKLSKLKYFSITNQMTFANEMEILAYYLNAVFMLPFIFHELAVNFIKNNKEDVKKLWINLGLIDAAIACANYEITLDIKCKPNFVINHGIKSENIYHPLIENPVTNSVNFDKNILISGSNASGKSTYVKSIAINSIFSQTIYIALAEKFSIKPGKVFTSMAIKDNIIEGDSYFIAEIKSLKRIIDDSKNNKNSYYFIDEILRGTNTLERISASASIIEYFIENNLLGMIATHDLELTSMFGENIKNIHFREELSDKKKISFSYKLQEGASETKNAIKLLDSLDFPKEIINRANQLAFENKI